MEILIIGTFNEHKGREIEAMLAGLPIRVERLSKFPNVQPVGEAGETLRENATVKALGFARQIGEFVVADDSGLEVDALQGAPGVRSARYAGEGASYAELVAKLLREMEGVPEGKRTARFRCCIALACPPEASASPEKVVLEAEGTCEGRILFEPRGVRGFGYDPVFVPNGFDKTFAEMEPELKNRLSHRGAAMRQFRQKLAAFLSREGADSHER